MYRWITLKTQNVRNVSKFLNFVRRIPTSFSGIFIYPRNLSRATLDSCGRQLRHLLTESTNHSNIPKIDDNNQALKMDDILRIESSIESADFVSYDFEMSGIGATAERLNGLTSMYSAYRQSVLDYIPIQLGIVAAKRSPTNPTHWIFHPSTHLVAPNRPFKSTLSTLRFLRKHNFDFNEWIDTSLPVITKEQQAAKEEAIQRQMKTIEEKLVNTPIPSNCSIDDQVNLPDPNDQKFVEKIRSILKQWLSSISLDENTVIDPLRIKIEDPTHRLLGKSVVKVEFPSLDIECYSETQELVIFRSQTDSCRYQLASLEQQKDLLSQNIGVRRLTDAISNSGVLLVGHNHLLDLLYLLSFYGDPPASFPELLESIKRLYPHTADTKHIYESVIGGLYSMEQDLPTLQGYCNAFQRQSHNKSFTFSIEGSERFIYNNFPATRSSSTSQSSSSIGCHHAGYDALLTAFLFVSEISYLLEKKRQPWEAINFAKLGIPQSTRFTSSSTVKGTKSSKLLGIRIETLLGSFYNSVRVSNAFPPTIKLA